MSIAAAARVAALALVLAAAVPAAAHHVGVYTPRDDDLSASYKQMRFALDAREFAVARRLFEQGPLRREMRARADALPPGLEAATRAALRAEDARGTERAVLILLVALVRDLAAEADRRLGEAPADGAWREVGRRFYEATWRYYNLIDFAMVRESPPASTIIRLAFDDVATFTDAERGPAAASDPEAIRAPFRRMADALTGVIEAYSPSPRRPS